jgi:hypothetical protein
MTIKKQLENLGFAPSSLVITWVNSGTKTATCNAAGLISGNASGFLNLNTGEVTFTPTVIPLGGTEFVYSYGYGDVITKTVTPINSGGGVAAINLGDTNITPGSIKLIWTVTPVDGPNIGKSDKDDGLGNLTTHTNVTVDYSAGVVGFTTAFEETYTTKQAIYA